MKHLEITPSRFHAGPLRDRERPIWTLAPRPAWSWSLRSAWRFRPS